MNVYLASLLTNSYMQQMFCKYEELTDKSEGQIAQLLESLNIQSSLVKQQLQQILCKIDFIKEINILESFYYFNKHGNMFKLTHLFDNFLLDSGAFTFIYNSKNINWDTYIEEYADFINKYDIKHFFELDIESIVGMQTMEYLRDKLEKLTGKKCIPVWHPERGTNYYIDMCKNYDYVALGSIAGVKKPRKRIEPKNFIWLINTAHKYKAKVHGLGYTSTSQLTNTSLIV